MAAHDRRTIVLAVSVLAASTLACTAAPSVSSPGGRPSDLPMSSLPAATVSPRAPLVTGEAPTLIVAAARKELAGRIGSGPASDAEVELSEAVTWPDGSLGCPTPGLRYQPIVTPGYRIVFSMGVATFDYRATEAGVVRLCERRVPGG